MLEGGLGVGVEASEGGEDDTGGSHKLGGRALRGIGECIAEMRGEMATDQAGEGEFEEIDSLIGLCKLAEVLVELAVLFWGKLPEGRQSQLNERELGPGRLGGKSRLEFFSLGQQRGVFAGTEELDLELAVVGIVIQQHGVGGGYGTERFVNGIGDFTG